jgi:hypothetical protein
MGSKLQKLTLIILTVAIITPTTFLAAPKKADAAAASCLMSALGPLIGATSVVTSIMSVPVNDMAVAQNTATGAGADVGTNLGECLLKALARAMAQSIIHNFSASVVDWINSGFHGSPSFVSNPEGFFANVGDIAAGQFIQGLGKLGDILCSPFDLQIRLALGLSLGVGAGGGKYQYYGCRLSDVQKNIYNAFTGGQWGSSGWSNWIAITQPQNNVYGAYLYAQDAMSQQILKKVGLRQQETLWSGGFLGSEKCYDEFGNELSEDELAEADSLGYYYECETQTPGSVIGAQLNKTLGIPADVLSVSQDIDDIINALVNQAISQVFSATGILGMGRGGSSYTGGRTYLSTMMTTYQAQLDTGKILPPTGINCSLTYRTNSDGSVDVLQGHWDRNADGSIKLTGGVGNCIKNNSLSTDPNECFVPTDDPLITVPRDASGNLTKTPAEFQNQITVGCQNLAAGAPAQAEINNLGAPGGALASTQGGAEATVPDTNVAIGKSASQSGLAYSVTTADRAVDGQISQLSVGAARWSNDLSYQYGSEATAPSATSPSWWQVDLGGNYKISQIKIFQPSGENWNPVSITPINVYISNDTSNWGNALNCSACGNDNKGYLKPIRLDNLNTTGRYVTVQKGVNGGTLALAEVQVFGSQVIASQGATPAGPAHSAAQITSPDPSSSGGGTPITLSTKPGQDSTYDNNDNLTISSSAAIPTLKVNVNLYQVGPTGTSTIAGGLAAIFNSFYIYRSINPNESNQSNLEKLSLRTKTPPDTIPDTISVNNISNTNNLTTYYLKIGGTIPQSLLYSSPLLIGKTYQLVVDISESAPPYLPVGTQTYTFTVKSPYVP